MRLRRCRGPRPPLRRGRRRALARSDEVALAELYDRYGRVAYGLALRVLRDEALAEDAVQEAFLAIWRGAARFIPERGKASTWILTLVHRRAVDLVRREQRRRTEPLTEADERRATEARRPTTPGCGSSASACRRRSRSSPTTQREAIELAYYGGFTQSELAERLGQPLGTIKSRMFAGLTRLRELLDAPGRGGMEQRRLHELTAAYALDALDADEARAYEEHLAGCADAARTTWPRSPATLVRSPIAAAAGRAAACAARAHPRGGAGRAAERGARFRPRRSCAERAPIGPRCGGRDRGLPRGRPRRSGTSPLTTSSNDAQEASARRAAHGASGSVVVGAGGQRCARRLEPRAGAGRQDVRGVGDRGRRGRARRAPSAAAARRS